MSEKPVVLDESLLAEQFQKNETAGKGRLKKGKHTLDSDEEDDEEDENDRLNEEDIEGEEEQTIDFDEDIQITPFNMREEMEEGHFDADGTFIFDKTKNAIKDNWMDNIDWVRVKASERLKAQERLDAQNQLEEPPPIDKVSLYREMLDILQPQESVAKALRRLAKSKGKPLTSAQRWKAKKLKMENGCGNGEETEKVQQDKKLMLRLTEIADQFVQEGIMDIYEATREKITFLLKQIEELEGSEKKFVIPKNADDDDALDMFADNFDKKESEKLASKEENKDISDDKTTNPDTAETSTSQLATEDLIMWEYKWEDTDTSPLVGPYTTSQMSLWKEEGHFKSGVLCRQINSKGSFYSSNRIDFDLYM